MGSQAKFQQLGRSLSGLHARRGKLQMQPRLIVPDARFRSPTAVAGKSDFRDEHVYSAIVVAHGGEGIQKVFTLPQGQAIPELKGSAITATANAHQLTFTEATTNMNKAGELGSAIGDASIRAIGVY